MPSILLPIRFVPVQRTLLTVSLAHDDFAATNQILGFSHVNDSSESSYVAKDNMTFHESFCRSRYTDFFTSKLRFERHSRCIAGLEHFSDLKSFLVSFSDPNHNIGDWSVVLKLAVKLMLVCVSSRFRASSLKACGQMKVN